MIKLNYKKYGHGDPLIILHGLFGSLDNWATLGRKWADNYSVYLVDLRNHGKSPHTESHTLEDMAGDIVDFIRDLGIEKPVILGHSMGGKVAMELALQHPDLIRGLIIVDIGAQSYKRGHDYIFDGIHSLDLQSVTSRKEIEEVLQKSIPNQGEVFFMSKNIDRTKEGFSWKINVETLEKDYEEVIKAIPAGRTFDGETLLVRGERSGYVKTEDNDLIRQFFPNIRIETIMGAGHWVHADKPDEFEEQVREFMGQF